MKHLIDTTTHTAYVYVVAFLGALGVSDAFIQNISTAHGAELALGPAALAALVKVAPKLGALATTVAAAEPTSGLAPESE